MKTSIVVVVGVLCAAIVGVGAYASRYTAQIEVQFPAAGDIVKVEGVATHVMRSGTDGTPVLLIHGAGGNTRELNTLIAPRPSGNHKVFSVDRPGHGYSEWVPNANELQTQANHIAGLFEALIPGEKAVVVGHSYGGAVALRLALDRPELLTGIVLLAPDSHDWGDDIAAGIAQLANSAHTTATSNHRD